MRKLTIYPKPIHFTLLLAMSTLLMACFLLPRQNSPTLTPQQQNGKRIYAEGTSSSGEPVVAVMNGIDVPASVLPCANCHAADGTGNPEGGVVPSNLQWHILTKPYTQTKPGGRTHAPYTASKVKKAISMGTDPSGNALHPTMPRYRMTLSDMADLIAYLKVLGPQSGAGVTDSTLTIGLLLPKTATAQSAAVHNITKAYIDETNSRGGLYGRRLVLQTEAPGNIPVNLPLAYAPCKLQWATPARLKAIDEAQIPITGIMDGLPPTSTLQHPHRFYTTHTFQMQAEALLGYKPIDSVVVVYDIDYPPHFIDAWKTRQLPGNMLNIRTARGTRLIDKLPAHTTTVIYLGPPANFTTLATGASPMGHTMHWYAPDSAPWQGAYGSYTAYKPVHLYTASSMNINQYDASAEQAYLTLATTHALNTKHAAIHGRAISGLQLLTEGLKQCGKTMSRKKLTAALEQINSFHTGLAPELTYSKTRRVGHPTLYLYALDAETWPPSATAQLYWPPEHLKK